MRRGLRDAVLARGRAQRLRHQRRRRRARRLRQLPAPTATPGVLLAFVGGSTWRTYGRLPPAERRQAVLEGFAAMFGEQALHPIEYTEHDWTRERWTPRRPDRASTRPGADRAVRLGDPAPVRSRALGRHRDLDVLDRLHGRRRPRRRARRRRGAGRAAMRRLARRAARSRAAPRCSPVAAPAGGRPGEVGRPRCSRRCRRRATRRTSTRTPTAGSTPAATSTPAAPQPSKVFEWSGDGTLLRSWTVPGQVLDQDHGVQVANQTRDGKLVAARDLDPRGPHPRPRAPGRFRRVATLPRRRPSPNYATWGPGGALFVTDYAQGVIWRVPRGGRPQRWFTSPALAGVEFGTTGIRFRPGTPRPADHPADLDRRRRAADQRPPLPAADPRRRAARGRCRRCGPRGPATCPTASASAGPATSTSRSPGSPTSSWSSTATGAEVDRFPDAPLTGDNGSPVPFDTPCSATFLGTACWSPTSRRSPATPSHQAILDVDVGERGWRRTCRRPRRF